MAAINNEKYHYFAKPHVFNRDKFDYWKDKIKTFFLGYDPDLWGMVIDGYTHPLDTNGAKLERRRMNDQQKNDNKNHRRSRIIQLNSISYTEYEKITNRDYAKSIFDSFRMTHEGNEKVKETKVGLDSKV